jgi:hypothetical protein
LCLFLVRAWQISSNDASWLVVSILRLLHHIQLNLHCPTPILVQHCLLE